MVSLNRRMVGWYGLSRSCVTVAMALALIGFSARAAAGQDAPRGTVKPGSTRSEAAADKTENNSGGLGLWSIAGMMDQACRNISKRYNLDPDQEKYTRALMARNLKAFLADHESELRSLLMDRFLIPSDDKADPKTAQRWAERAKPILEAARETIHSGNEDWRGILNAEQKRIHDADMSAMQVTFRQLDDRFERWQRGDYNPVRDRMATRSVSTGTDRSGTGRAGIHRNRKSLNNLSRVVGKKPYRRKSEDHWDAYVRRFIENHKLDESQKSTALAILTDCKERAANYRQAHADDLSKAETRMREAAATGVDRAARTEARKLLSEVNKPIRELFSELRARLDAIPSEKQKNARAEIVKAQRDKYMEKIRKRREDRKAKTQPASRPTSVPATSAPATSAPAVDPSAVKVQSPIN